MPVTSNSAVPSEYSNHRYHGVTPCSVTSDSNLYTVLPRRSTDRERRPRLPEPTVSYLASPSCLTRIYSTKLTVGC